MLPPETDVVNPAWKPIKPLIDGIVTLCLWTYYILGYFVFFSPLYLAVYLWARDREGAFQRLNHAFFKSFIGLLRMMAPGVTLVVPEEIRAIRSSVIVANHLSFLDPLLLIALFPRQKTIVRGDFFHTPVFGRLLRLSGYLPSSSEGNLSDIVLKQVEGMKDYLASGGNLFVFPEGTRSRTGRLGPFNHGAFRIAKFCEAPIEVLCIRNTHHLFPPDRFLFDTCRRNRIEVVRLGAIRPDYKRPSFSLAALMAETRSLFERTGCDRQESATQVNR